MMKIIIIIMRTELKGKKVSSRVGESLCWGKGIERVLGG
jgi:hypothetical protein